MGPDSERRCCLALPDHSTLAVALPGCDSAAQPAVHRCNSVPSRAAAARPRRCRSTLHPAARRCCYLSAYPRCHCSGPPCAIVAPLLLPGRDAAAPPFRAPPLLPWPRRRRSAPPCAAAAPALLLRTCCPAAPLRGEEGDGAWERKAVRGRG